MGFERVFIVGFGQMGKSIANTLRINNFQGQILASSRSKIENCDYIDNTFNIENKNNNYENSIIFICTPPNVINSKLEQVFEMTKKEKNIVITDICSIKQQILKYKNKNFISIHPMDGGSSNKNINQYFKSKILNYVIIDNVKNIKNNVNFNEYLKFLTKYLNYKNELILAKNHDKIVAFTSHLQNLILASYYNDFKRIDNEMWRDIFAKNQKNIAYFIKIFKKNIKNEIKTAKNLENAIKNANKSIMNSEKIDITPALFNPSLKNVFLLQNDKKIENKIKKEQKCDEFLQNMSIFFEKLMKNV